MPRVRLYRSEGRRTDLEQALSNLGNLESEFLAADATESQAKAQIVKAEADLDNAKYDLDGCVHLAPAKGRVANLALRPGVRAVQPPLAPVMSFIEEDDPIELADSLSWSAGLLAHRDVVISQFSRRMRRTLVIACGFWCAP